MIHIFKLQRFVAGIVIYCLVNSNDKRIVAQILDKIDFFFLVFRAKLFWLLPFLNIIPLGNGNLCLGEVAASKNKKMY